MKKVEKQIKGKLYTAVTEENSNFKRKICLPSKSIKLETILTFFVLFLRSTGQKKVKTFNEKNPHKDS